MRRINLFTPVLALLIASCIFFSGCLGPSLRAAKELEKSGMTVSTDPTSVLPMQAPYTTPAGTSVTSCARALDIDFIISLANSHSFSDADVVYIRSMLEHRYYISLLTPTLRDFAAGMYAAAVTGKDVFVPASPISEEEMLRAVYALRYDCPELFCISQDISYSMDNSSTCLSVDITHTLSPDKYSLMLDELHSLVSGWLDICSGKDYFETELYLYNRIMERCVYDITLADTGGSPYDALIGGRAVCEGFSKAFLYSMLEANLESIYVTGRADGMTGAGYESHSWNIALPDGIPCYVDVTWDNDDDGLYPIQVYSYFNMPHDVFSLRHVLDEDPRFPLPECTSFAMSYYDRHDLRLDADADIDGTLHLAFETAWKSGSTEFILVAATPEQYRQLNDALYGALQRFNDEEYRIKSYSYISDNTETVLEITNIEYDR